MHMHADMYAIVHVVHADMHVVVARNIVLIGVPVTVPSHISLLVNDILIVITYLLSHNQYYIIITISLS